jgi:ribosomal protein S18 acetylase RimI-like enzyme
MLQFTIREASIDDTLAIARLHAQSWKNTYRGILSDDFLDHRVDEDRKLHWQQKLVSLSDKDFVLAAEDNKELIGFIAVLDKPDAGFSAFIDNLHARTDRKGNGVGTALMRAAAKRLIDTNRASVYLWVLNGNDPAEEFYIRRGAKRLDSSVVSFGGKQVGQTRFGWHTLDSLL